MNENKQDTGGLFMLGLFLAIGLIVSAILLSGALKDIKSSGQTINVKGFAERTIKADLGIWSCNVTSRGLDMVTAYDKLKNDIQIAKEYLKKKGINDKDLSVSSVNTQKIFRLNNDGNYTNEIIGYELNQVVKVSSKDVNLIQELSNESTSLIQQGIEIFSNPPEFFYTKLDNLKIQMLGEAAKDAKVRAEQLAKNTDSEVSKLKSARQGVFQITPVNSVDVSDYGEYDLSTIDKSVKVVVTIEFGIE